VEVGLVEVFVAVVSGSSVDVGLGVEVVLAGVLGGVGVGVGVGGGVHLEVDLVVVGLGGGEASPPGPSPSNHH
jgi:hypothetical protein